MIRQKESKLKFETRKELHLQAQNDEKILGLEKAFHKVKIQIGKTAFTLEHYADNIQMNTLKLQELENHDDKLQNIFEKYAEDDNSEERQFEQRIKKLKSHIQIVR